MRLSRYINEDIIDDVEKIHSFNESIHKKCKPYLNLIKGKRPLIRQMYMDEIGIKKVRQDRASRGMGSYQAAVLNNWLQENGHVRRDKSVICISRPHLNFGRNYYIFPIGKFDYTFVESEDINFNDRDTGWYRDTVSDAIRLDFELSKPDLKKPFKDYFHTNKKFNMAYDLEYEMWIKCKEYYYIVEWAWDENKQIILYKGQ